MTEILPLLVFTTFGGVAAGAYVTDVLGLLAGKGADGRDERAWVFPLVCIVLLRVLHVGNVAVALAWLAVVVGYGVHLAGMGDYDRGVARCGGSCVRGRRRAAGAWRAVA